jgi:hypothetical protein
LKEEEMDVKRALVRFSGVVCAIALALGSSAGTMAQGDGTPGLRAFPDQDYVDGSNWPSNQTVYLKIGETLFTDDADYDGSVGFDLRGGEYDLQRGETLTMTSGDTTFSPLRLALSGPRSTICS